MQYRDMNGEDNHGTWWANCEMEKLRDMHNAGYSITSIAKKLKRRETACESRLVMIRIIEMFTKGEATDTLASYTKKVKEKKKVVRTDRTSKYDSPKGKSRVKISPKE